MEEETKEEQTKEEQCPLWVMAIETDAAAQRNEVDISTFPCELQ